MIEQPTLTEIAAPTIALLVSYVLFYEGFIYTIGSDSRFWTRIRGLLPMPDEEDLHYGWLIDDGADDVSGLHGSPDAVLVENASLVEDSDFPGV